MPRQPGLSDNARAIHSSRRPEGRQGGAQVFKKYSQMKLQMKREALAKLNRQANEGGSFGTAQTDSGQGFGTVE